MMRSNDIRAKGMTMKSLFVRAEWDEEACVWVATSDDVPGLATEAETTEALMAKLKVMIPELMEANGYGDGEEISFELFSRRFETARRLHA
jgi:predicted RNase H-like HicB family nuclease